MRVREDGSVDTDATHGLRTRIREQRLGHQPAQLRVTGIDQLPYDHDDPGSLGVHASDAGWHCRMCGGFLGDGDDWVTPALTTTSGAADRLSRLGVRVRPRAEVELHEHLCPHCGSALDVRIVAGA